MNVKLLLTSVSCLICFHNQAQNLFVADYGTGGAATYQSVLTYDRCLFSAFQGPFSTVVVMKTDSMGNVLWSKNINYQATGFFQFTAIEQATDSGFFLLLNITQPGATHSDPTVTKIDKNGNYLWTHYYISILSAFGYSIIRNNDNGFMITGTRQQNDLVLKCDDTGSITWIKQFHFANGAGNYDIASHDYIRFAITGRQGNNMVFFEIDTAGNLYWTNAISFANTGILGMSMKPVSNGGYAVTGRIKYIPGNYLDAFLLKIDSIGEVQWMKVYSASNETSPYDVVALSDNSLLVVGYNQGTNGNGFVLKTDQNGNLLFSRTELFPAPAQYASVHWFTPTTVLMSGRRGGQIAFTALVDTACTSICNITNFVIPEFQPTYSDTLLPFVPATLPFNQNSLSVLYYPLPLMRNLLCSSSSVMESAMENRITAYPNPVADKLFFSSAMDEISEITVINMNYEKLLYHQFTGDLTLDVSKLSQGMYFYEIRNGKGDLYRNKFVKE